MTGPHLGYFTHPLKNMDGEVYDALQGELNRQQNSIELIASENIVSTATLDALSSPIVNKTVEGYPGKRYYGGVEFADKIETLAINRAKKLFDCDYANVQPHSGSQANQAVYLALLKPGDTILSMALSAGGHLSHGAKPNLTGKWLSPVHYGVDGKTGLIDYSEVEDLAIKHRPKLIICGGSAYSRAIDFKKFRAIADQVGAYLMADMAHFAGLVAGGEHPSPIHHAHVSTATTYKNLRGVRGGLILCNDEILAKKFNSAVFPGIQGSSILNAIAAKAVCLGEALRPEFKDYAKNVLLNARMLSGTLVNRGIHVVSGSTDTPLVLVDLRSIDLTGDVASTRLEHMGLTCNKNSVPGDTQPPTITSGLRFGVSAGTTRGFRTDHFKTIGNLIADVLMDNSTPETIQNRVKKLTQDFPIYPDL